MGRIRSLDEKEKICSYIMDLSKDCQDRRTKKPPNPVSEFGAGSGVLSVTVSRPGFHRGDAPGPRPDAGIGTGMTSVDLFACRRWRPTSAGFGQKRRFGKPRVSPSVFGLTFEGGFSIQEVTTEFKMIR